MYKVHSGRRQHIGMGFWVGATFLALAASLYAKATTDGRARNWEPLSLSISLVPGTIETPELGTNLDGGYNILITFEKKIEFHRMECLLGVLQSNGMPPVWCNQVPNLIDISWTLYEDGRAVSQGDSKKYSGGVWSARVERHIGSFVAKRGHRYRLVLRVKRNASELNNANPKLVIMVPRGEAEGYGAAIALEKLGAAILALIGMTIVLVTYSIFFSRSRV